MILPAGLRAIDDFRDLSGACPGERLRSVREAATGFRERFRETGMPTMVRTCDLITLPYPTRYAFWHAIRHPSPYLMFTNRMLVVRYRDHEGAPRILLFNPTDFDRAAEVPFYRRLADRYGPFMTRWILSSRHRTVAAHLEGLGIAPSEVDHLSFDHLHTQDLRGWIGPEAFFPRAKLLVQRPEWGIFEALHPLQEWWYIARATEGVSGDRVVLLDGDVSLGEGVALLATPGHTRGNHSLALHTPGRVTVISENGVSLDNYAPEASRLPGLAAYARTGQEVVLNGNTLEGALEQYISMIKEKEVAGAHPAAPEFPDHFSSSELTAHWLFPGLAPTLAQTALTHGDA